MARNGYSFKQPQTVFFTELQAMFGGKRARTPESQESAAANQAQIATASPTPAAPTPRTWKPFGAGKPTSAAS